MKYPKLAIMLEDNQQTTRASKDMAIRTKWVEVSSWRDVEALISQTWQKVDKLYSAVPYTKFKNPSTLAVRVGIKINETRTFSRINYQRGRKKSIRTYPDYDERYNFHKLQESIREEITEINGFAEEKIHPQAKQAILTQFRTEKNCNEAPLFAPIVDWNLQDQLSTASTSHSLW